jgi:hypothetical protein
MSTTDDQALAQRTSIKGAPDETPEAVANSIHMLLKGVKLPMYKYSPEE